MSVLPTDSPEARGTAPMGDATDDPAKDAIVAPSLYDPSACVADRAGIESWIPHRHEMALLDRVAWVADDYSAGVGVWDVRDDEFWVRGHFPQKALLPGVLQVEAGAQLACFLYNAGQKQAHPAVFLRIEEASFRRGVEPGQQLLILCRGVKSSSRRFISDVQGIVDGQVSFNGRIHGMNMRGKHAF